MTTMPRRYHRSSFLMSHVINPVSLRLGGPALIVRGRHSGREIRTLLPTFDFEGERYLVSGGGETDWVRNLRAAGRAVLRRGRARQVFLAVEVKGDPHDRIVAAYRVKMGRRAREFFRALPDPADHPVFRVEAFIAQK